MKIMFKFNLSRGLALTVLALSLASSSSFAQISATPTMPTTPAAGNGCAGK